MKQVILSVLCTIMTLSSFAQELNLSSEDEIFDKQMSTNYFYGECTETYESSAMSNALANLVANAKSNGVTIESKDVVYYYYVSETGGIQYLHVYAFVEKNKYQPKVSVAQQTTSDGAEVTMPSNQQQSKNPSSPIPPKNYNSKPALPVKNTNEFQTHVEQTTWKREAIDNLIKAEDLPSVIERIERMIVTKKIAGYGRYQDCKDKTNVCWAVFDSQNRLIAILGDGSQYRYNYKTKKTDELELYISPSYKILWFSFDD